MKNNLAAGVESMSLNESGGSPKSPNLAQASTGNETPEKSVISKLNHFPNLTMVDFLDKPLACEAIPSGNSLSCWQEFESLQCSLACLGSILRNNDVSFVR